MKASSRFLLPFSLPRLDMFYIFANCLSFSQLISAYVRRALAKLPQKWSSRDDISAYVEENFDVCFVLSLASVLFSLARLFSFVLPCSLAQLPKGLDERNFRRILRMALVKGVESGLFIQNNRSFRPNSVPKKPQEAKAAVGAPKKKRAAPKKAEPKEAKAAVGAPKKKRAAPKKAAEKNEAPAAKKPAAKRSPAKKSPADKMAAAKEADVKEAAPKKRSFRAPGKSPLYLALRLSFAL